MSLFISQDGERCIINCHCHNTDPRIEFWVDKESPKTSEHETIIEVHGCCPTTWRYKLRGAWAALCGKSHYGLTVSDQDRKDLAKWLASFDK